MLDTSSSGTNGAESGEAGLVSLGAGDIRIGGGGGGAGSLTILNNPSAVALGGHGGKGATFSQSVPSSNAGVIVGGGGGAAGSIDWHIGSPNGAGFAASVRGGDGGTGAELTGANMVFANSGIIWGGGGGAPSMLFDNANLTFALGTSGSGGAGLIVTSNGAAVTNTGTIHGGNAGLGGGAPGLGGNGVLVSGNLGSIIQAGTIAGGLDNSSLTRREAVLINGQGNTLTLHPTSTTTGNVIFNGADNRLQIGSGSAATAAIDGSVSLGSGGVFRVRATPAAFDRLNVTGNAVVNQARVDVQAAQGAYSETFSQVILHADGTLTGTRFTGVTSNLAYLTPTLSYSADDRDVTLMLTRAPSPVTPPVTPEAPPVTSPSTPPAPPAKIRFADLVNGGNARAVADAAETLGAGHAVYDAAIGLPQGAPQDFFAGLSGEMHAGVSSGLSNLSSTVRNVPLNQLRGNLNAGFAPGAPTAAAGASDATPSAAALPSSLARPAWAQIVGNWQRIGATGDTSALRQHTGGVFVGADHGVGNGWRLGGALGYTDSKQRVDDLASKADVSSYSAVLYGGKAIALGAGKLNVMAGASYTWHDIATERRIDAGGLNQTLDSNYGGNTTQLFTEVGYAFAAARGLTLEPYAGLAWAGQRTRGFSEAGGSAALSGDSTRNNITTTTLGLRAAQQVTLGTLAGAVSGGLSWRHAFGDLRPESRLAFNAGESFTVTGAPIAQDAALVEAGLDAQISRTATLGLAYAGQFGGGNRDQTASVNLRWAF
ncbi:autotransporter outer membrane beta-barrel domain-containing protein [Achromobacter spanius]|uniref:autotransporter family protein n=1 Tax=Achromobacter spanius TaxID=217203 RepID=UPI003209D52E